MGSRLSTVRIERTIKVKNPQGLHARPAALLVQIANKYGVNLTLQKGNTTVDGHSIMGILMLEVGKGNVVKVVVEGEAAQEALKEIEALLTNEEPIE